MNACNGSEVVVVRCVPDGLLVFYCCVTCRMDAVFLKDPLCRENDLLPRLLPRQAQEKDGMYV